MSPKLAEVMFASFREERLQALENTRILNGEEGVKVNEFDDHKAHLEKMDPIKKHPFFIKLPDEIQTRFLAHYNIHLERLNAKNRELLKLAQAQAGGPGMAPTAPAPGEKIAPLQPGGAAVM